MAPRWRRHFHLPGARFRWTARLVALRAWYYEATMVIAGCAAGLDALVWLVRARR
jgi:hypothetical protein